MAKNIEWGAIAYLTQSIYGANTTLRIASTTSGEIVDSYGITGCGSSFYDGEDYNCAYTYETARGQEQSTTGNIYGIYDMVGGAPEYTAAYVANGIQTYTAYANENDDDCSVLFSADAKYKDIYFSNDYDDSSSDYIMKYNYSFTYTSKGDGIWETSYPYNCSSLCYYDKDNTTWQGGYATMPYGKYAFFTHATGATLFGYGALNSGPYTGTGFRPIILVQSGL
jgi:hypothetical protein